MQINLCSHVLFSIYQKSTTEEVCQFPLQAVLAKCEQLFLRRFRWMAFIEECLTYLGSPRVATIEYNENPGEHA